MRIFLGSGVSTLSAELEVGQAISEERKPLKKSLV